MDVISVVEGNETNKDQNAKIAGFTCLKNDILYEGYYGKPIERGDYLSFKNVGAYTIVLNPIFKKMEAILRQ